MVIPDNLRQEHMPMMIYAICSAVKSGEYVTEDLVKAMTITNTVDDSDSQDRVNYVLNYMKKAGFVEENKVNSKLSTEFLEAELKSPMDFSTALLKRLDLENSEKFLTILKWFLWKGPVVEGLENHKAVRAEMMQDSQLKHLKISEEYVHGFMFLVEFLGIATHSYQAMGCYNYSIENILLKYINKHKALLKSHGNMPVKEFLNLLAMEICFIPYCYANTEICYALSFALRVLEKMNVIELQDKDDGSMTWHLIKSQIFTLGNSFTNIRVN